MECAKSTSKGGKKGNRIWLSKEAKECLREIGATWVTNTEDSSDVYHSQRASVFELIYHECCKKANLLGEGIYRGYDVAYETALYFIENYFDRFDPDKSSLVTFCDRFLNYAVLNVQKDLRDKDKMESYIGFDEEIGKEVIKQAPPILFTDIPDDNDGNKTDNEPVEEKIPAPESDPADFIGRNELLHKILSIYFDKLTAMILNYLDLPDIRHSQIKLNYYKMWYAERVVFTLKHIDWDATTEDEEEMFHAMDLDYLDSFMSEEVRTIQGLADTPLKPEKDFNPDGEDGKEVPWKKASYHDAKGRVLKWLIAEVPMKYKNVVQSVISEQRKDFTQTFNRIYGRDLEREFRSD